MNKIFFQSSLPRSGSTLLQNIMGQNPKFYVTPTSGVLELVFAARKNYTDSLEFQAQDAELMRNAFLGFCKQGLEGYYNSITDKEYVLDKSRGWGIHYNFLNAFYPDPKILVMIRDPRDILASMEKKFRQNQDKDSGLVDHANMQGTTTEKRIDIWASSQPFGMAMERLYQMIKEGIDKKVHFIKYENLTLKPERELSKIYDFLGVEPYEHDFDNIEQVTQEDDSVYGIYGDHKIQNKLSFKPSNADEILGSNAAEWVRNNYAWFYERFLYF